MGLSVRAGSSSILRAKSRGKYGFTHHCLRTSLARAAHDAIAVEVEVENARIESRMWTLNKDERRQDNGDKKRLARQHLSNLLCSLTRERDRRKSARRRLDSALSLPFRTLHVLGVRHNEHA